MLPHMLLHYFLYFFSTSEALLLFLFGALPVSIFCLSFMEFCLLQWGLRGFLWTLWCWKVTLIWDWCQKPMCARCSTVILLLSNHLPGCPNLVLNILWQSLGKTDVCRHHLILSYERFPCHETHWTRLNQFPRSHSWQIASELKLESFLCLSILPSLSLRSLQFIMIHAW